MKQPTVLILTALDSMSEKIIALEAGAEGLYSKPFDRVHFIEQIETLIEFKKNKSNTQIIAQNARLDNVLHRQSEELIHYYYTDSLTGLSNRSQLIKDINNVHNSSLIFIDIDRFKVTMGASMFVQELLISAEKALKTAKMTNKNVFLYDEKSEEFRSYEQNIFWIKKIAEAILSDKVVPFYQPIVNNKTNKIEKYECLVRIIDKDETIHTPMKFLEISKKSRNYAAITKAKYVHSDSVQHKVKELGVDYSQGYYFGEAKNEI